MSILDRILPARADNRFGGQRASLWLLGLYVALKLPMGVNSILDTRSVATGADGIPLDSFGPAAAREVLTLFALTSLGQLVLALIALVVLLRYRALVPLVYLVLIGEMLVRRIIVQSHALTRTADGSLGWSINIAILVLLTIGFALALVPSRGARDRKSTRLNSSHANISYAVFCLKKKKKS